jgi:xanthine dehydrogenase accessory factor
MITMLKNKLILVKGAGDFASGTIRRLHLAGAKVIATELEQPLTIRRMVAFSQAIYDNEHEVEGVIGVKSNMNNIDQFLIKDKVPVLVDPETKILDELKFNIVIDGRMAKKNLGTGIDEAPIVIGLGPGFIAGVDCNAVVETLAGHNLGRVIYEGKPAEDTGVPIPTDLQRTPCCAGFTPTPCCAGSTIDVNDYLIRAPADGEFNSEKSIGDLISTGDILGRISEIPVKSKVDGVLRGLIHGGVQVTKGLKIGDIDPSGDKGRVFQVSEKANAIAGGVLEAVLFLLNRNEIKQTSMSN